MERIIILEIVVIVSICLLIATIVSNMLISDLSYAATTADRIERIMVLGLWILICASAIYLVLMGYSQ